MSEKKIFLDWGLTMDRRNQIAKVLATHYIAQAGETAPQAIHQDLYMMYRFVDELVATVNIPRDELVEFAWWMRDRTWTHTEIEGFMSGLIT